LLQLTYCWLPLSASTDRPDHTGNTFLHLASQVGCYKVFDELLSKQLISRVDFFQQNHAGETVLTMADASASPSHKAIGAFVRQYFKQWQTVILPELTMIAAADCAGLLKELVDLTLQYLDGHGPAFERKRKTENEVEEKQ
jgi:hypothetical protein